MQNEQSRESSPDIIGDNDDERLSTSAPAQSPRTDSDLDRPQSSSMPMHNHQSMSQSCSGSVGSPSPGFRYIFQNSLHNPISSYICCIQTNAIPMNLIQAGHHKIQGTVHQMLTHRRLRSVARFLWLHHPFQWHLAHVPTAFYRIRMVSLPIAFSTVLLKRKSIIAFIFYKVNKEWFCYKIKRRRWELIIIFDECVSVDCVLNVHKLITVNKHFGNDVMIVILILLSSLCIPKWIYRKISSENSSWHSLYQSILVHHRSESNHITFQWLKAS